MELHTTGPEEAVVEIKGQQVLPVMVETAVAEEVLLL